jgi:L-threonylcarbamoyladenylate synthase
MGDAEYTNEIQLRRAAIAVMRGGIVAYPTEGVYGLGCLPEDAAAVERLLALKRRARDKGLVLIAAELEQLLPLVTLPRGGLREEIVASWPGPTTWVLPARRGVPRWITGGRDSVAVRVTAHPVARALCARIGQPIVSTSANRSGRPPLRRVLSVRRELGRDVDFVLAGALGGLSGPTPIRDGRSGDYLRRS